MRLETAGGVAMTSHRRTGGVVEAEIDRRIIDETERMQSAMQSAAIDAFELGRCTGRIESLRSLKRWIVEGLYANDNEASQ